MKDNKLFLYYWLGFLVTGLAVAGLYWFWRRRQAIAPRPLILVPGPLQEMPGTSHLVAKQAPVDTDDLQAITGIGPVFARRLNDAGVTTYRELIACTPEELRQLTRVQDWQSDPADWIAEARDLLG